MVSAITCGSKFLLPWGGIKWRHFRSIILFLAFFVDRQNGLPKEYDLENTDPLFSLKGKCFDTAHIQSWWSYVWCFRDDVRQLHLDDRNVIQSQHFLGKFIPNESQLHKEVYKHNVSNCISISGLSLLRHADVLISCCRDENWSAMHDRFESSADLGTFVESVTEISECEYHFKVCSDLMCPRSHREVEMVDSEYNDILSNGYYNSEHNGTFSFANFLEDQKTYPRSSGSSSDINLSEANQLSKLERVRSMFHHGYDMYMQYAQPESELRPITCDGAPFELVKIPLVTLIDTLDTLVIMQNHTEFRRAVGIVCDYYSGRAFDLDVNVSVFETTIRVLGGLLAAHLMAVDPLLGVYTNDIAGDGEYDGELLRLAHDLGERLLPAFATLTGIPYGTVNLRYGVPLGETEIASTAGAGSLLLEFEVLSSLSGDDRFGTVAFIAVQALYSRRSFLGLLGKHIHTSTGQWHESSSGIGSNADSFYEYLLKGHLLSHRSGLFPMFADTYQAVKRHIQVGDWFTEVDMFNGKSRRNRVENLQAFWPGMESMLGLCDSAARLLNTFYAVWQDVGYLPEEFDQEAWLDNKVIGNSWYPLRPELIESTYHQYRSTSDRSWLLAGSVFLDALENTRTECGFASVSNIGSMQLTNNMPSYFLSETCKYLYLLFDENNFVHDRAYVFSTEAHPFDPSQLPVGPSALSRPVDETAASLLLPLKCQKSLWWDSSLLAYDANYVKGRQNGLAGLLNTEAVSARYSVTVMNSARVAALLHSSSRADEESGDVTVTGGEVSKDIPSPDRRPDTCYDGDIVVHPTPTQANEPASDRGKKRSSPQKTSISTEAGEFDVTMYADGFMVVSKEHGDTLEITNVGEALVFVSYSWPAPSSRSKTIIGDHSGRTVTCSVTLVDGQGEVLNGDENRSCSIATFGPDSLPASPIIAELYVPPSSNEMACKPVDIQSHTSSAADGHKEAPSVPKSWWREWPSATAISGMLSRGYSKISQIKSEAPQADAKILLARRGDCLFEEKTMIAEAAGAAAVIIANSENFLFVMSGKKQSGSPDGSITAEPDKLSVRKATIPTVMITKSDAESLLETFNAKLEGNGHDIFLPIRARIDLSSSPSMLDSDYMGGSSYPKLRVGQRVMHVVGGGLWGVVLNSANGREWQLYIMSAIEVAASMAVTPWHASTAGSQPVSTSYAASMQPLDLYRNTLARQCPKHVAFDEGGGRVVINRQWQ